MGFQDRDYARTGRRQSVGTFQPLTVTTWLIVINVAVFLIDGLLLRSGYGYVVTNGYRQHAIGVLERWGFYSIDSAIFHVQIWRFITFQFLHANLNHILFNMMTLFFMGPLIEAYLGRRKFLAFYLLSGIGGPIAYTILWRIGVWGATVPADIPLVGASAGIFGVLVAAAMVAPNEEVLVLGSIPAKLKTVALVLLAIAVYTVFTSGQNAGGEAAHLGGAVVGFVLIRNDRWLNVFEYGYKSGRSRLAR